MISKIIRLILVALVGYFLGNISPARLMGRISGVDITSEGSGNPGTTNVIRTLGMKAGLITLLIDVAKAFLAVKLGNTIVWSVGGMVGFAAVVLGHCFPALYGFKGGKGVACALGAAFALNFWSAFAAFIIAVAVLLYSKKMSLGSLAAGIAYPVLMLLYEPTYFVLALAVAAFLVFTHIPNIKRLKAGEEPDLDIIGKIREMKNKEADSE